MPSSDITELQNAIRAVHGCESTHIETVPVTEAFKGQVAWDGEVEVFRLKGHAKADRCFAWAYDEGGKRKVMAVLEIPPVDGPETAVKAAIAASAKPGTFKP
jgi:hypothetical protein